MDIKYWLCMNDLSDVSVDVVKLLKSLRTDFHAPMIIQTGWQPAITQSMSFSRSFSLCLSHTHTHKHTPFGLAHHSPAPILPSVPTVTVPATAYPLPVTISTHT